MDNCRVIVIGGSAGSFQVVTKILLSLPADFQIPIVMCLHRLKHVREGFVESLQLKSKIKIKEPLDKEQIKPNMVYLAPSNYHLLCDIGGSFVLSRDIMVKYSRPSIDLTYETFSYAYKEKMLAIILSGANTDGADGMAVAHERGAKTIIQSVDESSVKTMPAGAKALFKPAHEFTTDQIIKYLIDLSEKIK